MAKGIAICRTDSSGGPNIGTGWHRWVKVGDLPGQYAVYVIVGSGPQLIAIDAHQNCVAGLQVTGAGRWPELDLPVPAGLRTRINAYRATQGQGPIGAGVTLLQVMRGAAAAFDWGTHDVWDGA